MAQATGRVATADAHALKRTKERGRAAEVAEGRARHPHLVGITLGQPRMGMIKASASTTTPQAVVGEQTVSSLTPAQCASPMGATAWRDTRQRTAGTTGELPARDNTRGRPSGLSRGLRKTSKVVRRNHRRVPHLPWQTGGRHRVHEGRVVLREAPSPRLENLPRR